MVEFLKTSDFLTKDGNLIDNITIPFNADDLVYSFNYLANNISVNKVIKSLVIGLTNLTWVSINSDKDSKVVFPTSSSFWIASIEVFNRTGQTELNF